MNFVALAAGPTRLGPTLSLKRAPTYLRFVYFEGDWSTLDALDQLDDEPQPGETIVVGRIEVRGRWHVDRIVNRKRVGEWYGDVRYQVVDPQPADDVVRDTAAWRAWCLAEQAREREATQA